MLPSLQGGWGDGMVRDDGNKLQLAVTQNMDDATGGSV